MTKNQHWTESFFKVAALCVALACAGSSWHCNGEEDSDPHRWSGPTDLSHCIPLWEAYWRLPECGGDYGCPCLSSADCKGVCYGDGGWSACKKTCIGTCSGPDVNHSTLLGCHCTDWPMYEAGCFGYTCMD